jgi:glyoxylase-like metal-dependent hydrolase (beta-lactamase superfamily II)
MTNRRKFLQSGFACSLFPSLLSVAAPLGAQGTARGNEPVVVETPWGQRVVPTLDTYVDIQTYLHLRPGQAWAEGEALGRKLREDYRAGRVKLRRYPWRVAEGVFVLGQAEMEQQIYLIDTGQGLLLIDPSLDAWQDELIGQIRQLGFDPAEVKWVLLTHCHIDHGQSCYRWRTRGARILAGEGDAHPIETCNSLVATWVETQAEGHCTPCPVDQHVQDGDVLLFGGLTLHAIATPGHTPGSTCYYFERGGTGFLVSGDIALHNGRHAWMGNPYADWGQYLGSLGKLVHFALDGKPIRFDVLLPGHGTVDLEQAYRSVEETVRIVRSIVARRAAGENVDWIEPYPWNWNQGIVYTKGG